MFANCFRCDGSAEQIFEQEVVHGVLAAIGKQVSNKSIFFSICGFFTVMLDIGVHVLLHNVILSVLLLWLGVRLLGLGVLLVFEDIVHNFFMFACEVA